MIDVIDLEYHRCNSTDEKKFFKADETLSNIIDQQFRHMYCFDDLD